MKGILANAESWDPTNTELVLILLCSGGIIAVCAMAGFVVIVIKRRQHAHTQAIFTIVMFWALFALGSVIYATITQLNWNKQYLLELLSGYGDPNAVGPALPWVMWGALVFAYLGLLMWSFANVTPREREYPPVPPSRNGNGHSGNGICSSRSSNQPTDPKDRRS